MRTVSIAHKLVGLIVVLMSVIVGFLAIYFPSAQLRTIRQGLTDKALRYGDLLGIQSRNAVAFDDHETAREILGSLKTDPDVVAITLVGAGGVKLGQVGSPSPWVARVVPGRAGGVHELSQRIAAIVPVISREGPEGTLVIELSNARMLEGRHEILRAAIVGGAVALGFGTFVAWVIARSLARRLRAVARVATAVTAGDAEVISIEDTSSDELGVLTRAFTAMLAQLRAAHHALEDRVRARTTELDRKNQDLRLVFDHVGQGIVTADATGAMSPARSAILDRWLGRAAPGATIWEYLASRDPEAAAWVEVGWNAVFDGTLPVGVALGQLPRSMAFGDRLVEVDYTPIPATGTPNQVLVVLSDVTTLAERARCEADQQDLLAAFQRLMTDRIGFVEFFHETDRALARVADVPPDEARLTVHTIKGNAGIFGLVHVASDCHVLEQALLDDGPEARAGIDALCSRWARLASAIRSLLDDRGDDRLDVEVRDVERVCDLLRHGSPADEVINEVLNLVEGWRREPMELRLARIGAQATTLAERLGKPIRLEVAPHQVRLDVDAWAPFWAAFGHLVRNAVDHGIEPPRERRERGKPAEGRVALATELSDGALIIRITDDGRGIEWSQVAERARSMGLPSDAPAHLIEALFAEGLSTRDQVTDVSGRGLGMAALRAACRARGGDVTIASTPGLGTTIECRFPPPSATAPCASRERAPALPG